MSKRTTLRGKLNTNFLAVAVGTVTAACVAFTVYDRQNSAETKELVLGILTRAVAGAAEGPTTFQDPESAGRVLGWLETEPTAEVATIFVEDGTRLAEWHRGAEVVPGKRDELPAAGYLGAKLAVVQPILSEGKPIGVLYARFNTQDLDARTERFLRIALGVLGVAFLFSLVLARGISARISEPVVALAAVAEEVRVTRNYQLKAEKKTDDELGVLTDAFNEMLAGIHARDAELEHHRQHLEAEVAARTADLDARNHQMRLVLDNVSQGFATIDVDGGLASERSAAFDRWFDRPASGVRLQDLVARHDPAAAAWLEVGLDGLRANELPYEALLDQLPASVVGDGRALQLEYRAIAEGERVVRILIMVTDVTERRERERAEQLQREMVIIFERLSKDRAVFLEFVDEAAAIVARLRSGTLSTPEAFRALHTLKGSAGLYQLTSLSSVAHELETGVSETGGLPGEVELMALDAAFAGIRAMVDSFLGKRDGLLDVPQADLELLKARIAQGEPREHLLRWLREWNWEPASKRLEQVGEQARALARRLGKGEIDVVAEGGALRLPPERLRAFWSAFTHAVRNAVDHGLETPEARQLGGKSPVGLIRLLAARVDQDVVIELADDGAGVDWARVRAKADAMGLPSDTPQALERALFHDGLSTRDQVTDVSGRGVGLAAVREVAIGLGGRVEVTSVRGQGTSFRFVFDADALGLAPPPAVGSGRASMPVSRRASLSPG